MLGLGVVLIPALEPLLRERPDLVDWVEIEPQTLWRHDPTRETYWVDDAVLARLRALPQRKLVHGVGFPVGSGLPPDPRQDALLKRFLTALDCPWWSEHLSFNRVPAADGEFQAGFFLPPLQSPVNVDLLASTIRGLRQRIPGRFAIETGVNYLQPLPGELSDGAFWAAVSRSADCDILLDLHNLWANERNGRQSMEAVCAELPLDRVVEVHLAGGRELGGLWLDAHSGVVPAELLERARKLLPSFPRVQAVVFEILPEAADQLGPEGLLQELERLRAFVRSIDRAPGQQAQQPSPRPLWQASAAQSANPGGLQPGQADLPSPEQYEACLGALVNNRPAPIGSEPLAAHLQADPGLPVFQELVRSGRTGRIAEGASLCCRLIGKALSGPALARLLDAFMAASPPQRFATDECLAFLDYLLTEGPLDQVPGLRDALHLEIGLLQSFTRGRPSRVRLHQAPEDLIRSVLGGRAPTPAPEPMLYELTP